MSTIFSLYSAFILSDVTLQYATATFKVLNAYAGWSNVNYVLNDVKNPVRTLKIAGPLGLGICAVLYMLANISYFACVPSACFWPYLICDLLIVGQCRNQTRNIEVWRHCCIPILWWSVWETGAEGFDCVRCFEVLLRDFHFSFSDFDSKCSRVRGPSAWWNIIH